KPLPGENASSFYLCIAGRQPWQRIDRLAVVAQLEIKARLRLIGRHAPDRLAGDQPLADAAVDSVESRHERMIPIAMSDDQDFAVAAEGAGKDDPAVEGRDDFGARASGEGNAFGGFAGRGGGPEADHHLAGG